MTAKAPGARALATISMSLPKTAQSDSGFVSKQIALSDGQTGEYAAFERPIEKPLLDNREYKLIRLPNELEVMIISDPETDKASAAMDVRVGHLSDPHDLQGMAHYCEHLLFMGTKKYPRENEYSEYLSNHSGSSNAFTSLENTNYFFDVGHEHFEGALDRFAQFFLEPLFDASCSEREIRAVDSEHKKNLQSDLWRSFQLEKSLSDASHPYSKFGTGNLTTLWEEPRARGVDIREELLKFHAKYYSANMMKLVVIGRESVEQLTRWVVEKFSSVPNKGNAVPRFPESPLGPEQLGTQVLFRTIKDLRSLELTFPFPEQVHLYKSKPGQLISHFLGHEGHGSLFSCLKQRGWANMLSAGSGVGAEGFELFKVAIDLTPEGYEHYEEVAAAMFQYLDLLRTQSIEEWMYHEVEKLSELRFAFKEKTAPSSYGSALASQMQTPMPPEWILSGHYLLREFDLPLIQDTLACLRPDRCRIMLAGREPPAGHTLDAKERWYGTEYTVVPLPASLATRTAALDGMALPKQNEFIPADLQVLGSKDAAGAPVSRPQLLRNTPLVRLWHKQDDRFFLPKANVSILLRTPRVNESPRTAVLSRVMVELVKDALSEFSYDAEVAGLLYNVDSQLEGLVVVVAGYNDKLPLLLQSVLDTLTQLVVDEKRFAIVMDQVRRNYQNFDMEEPYQHAAYYSLYLLTEQIWTQHEKLAAMDGLTAADVQAYIPWVCEQLHVEMLVHGNVDAAQAEALLDRVVSHVDAQPLPEHETLPPRSLLLAPGSNSAWKLPVANPGNVNSSLEYYVQVGDPTDVPLRATLALFAQIAHEPCFDQLRTKEQLGYLVFSGVRRNPGAMGFRVIVQSERDSDYLESRIDAFFDQLRTLLRNLTPDEFAAHKRSLIQKKRESVKNLAEETNRFWTSIHSGYYDFLSRERDIEELERLTKDDVLHLMDTYVHPSSRVRAKNVTHLQAQGTSTPLSPAAFDAFLAFLAERDAPVPDEARADLAAQAQSVEALRAIVEALYAQGAVPADLAEADVLAAVDRVAAAHPAAQPAADSDTVVRDVLPVHTIDDVRAFKASLRASDVPHPILPWSAYEQAPQATRDAELAVPGARDAAPNSVRANM
ncbi:hypothetical protein CBS9595_002672 [Malassezia furfur]|nr:hypothetical protein CBS9595_002672 [Malassezia furfur]